MKDEMFIALVFGAGIAAGAGMMFFPVRGDLIEQDKLIANLVAETKIKPLITVDALGICQVKQGGKVYMLVDITGEIQGADPVDEIGLEEKHQLIRDHGDEK